MKKDNELKENWGETKMKLKQKFAILTDNDLLFPLSNDKNDGMLARLEIKLGKSKAEIQKIISELL